MRKAFNIFRNITPYFFIIFFILSLNACFLYDHSPGDPGSFHMDKKFTGFSHLNNQKMDITIAKSKGIFSKFTMENYTFDFYSPVRFNYFRFADHALRSSGTFNYKLNAAKRRATLMLNNTSGMFSKTRMIMQLSFYRKDMGIFKIWLKNRAKTNYATGIFKITGN